MSYITGPDERVIGGLTLEQFEAPMDEVLGTAWDQTMYDNPTAQIFRMRDRARAEFQGRPLDAETARAKFAEAGVDYKVPESGMTEPLLNLILEDKKQALQRQQVLERAPSGFVNGSLQFTTALGASILDPLNIASAFIPVVGEARFAKLMQTAGTSAISRAGVRAGVGAVEGAVGQAMLEPLTYLSRDQDQIDYDMSDVLLNVAFGAAFGSALHTGGGFVKDRFFTAAPLPVVKPDFQPTAAADIAARMNPETHMAAMKAAISQAASGRLVDVEALTKLDPAPIDKGIELRTLRDETIAAKEAYEKFEADVRAGTEPDADTYFKLSDGMREAEARLAAQLEKLPDESFALEAKTRDGRTLMLNGSAQKPGHWQLTRFGSDGQPWGDTQYPTKAQAIKDFLDEADTATVNDFDNSFAEPTRGHRDSQPKDHDLSQVRAAAERSQAPESSIAADVKAAADAEAQLKEAPKDYDLDVAKQQLTDIMNDLKATADQLGVEPGLKEFDDQLKRADQYEKAVKAAAVCGMRG